MHIFFASLRKMLAYVDLERMDLGGLVRDTIRDEFIPRLKRRLETARTDRERDQITELISEYEKYADPNSSESRTFGKTAASIVRTQSQRAAMNEEAMEDFTQELALDFFRPLVSEGDSLRSTILKFNEMHGPVQLNKYWAHIVDLRLRFHIREAIRKHQERTKGSGEGEEGEDHDWVSQVPAPKELDEGYVRQVMNDLNSFMHKKLKRPEMVQMFDRWMELATDKGAENVDFRHDVVRYLQQQGIDAAQSTMTTWWLEVKRLIVRFFEKELEGSVSYPLKKMLRISTAEVLTYEVFRHRVAVWVLGGMLRGIIEAGE